MLVAVTGGIGAGKSSIAVRLAELLDAVHCDTDRVCRDLLQKDNPGWKGVVGLWGDRFLMHDDQIDRQRLRRAIFEDPAIRRELEQILHPPVREHVIGLQKLCLASGKNLVVEVPLLFEAGWQDDFDAVVVVYAEKQLCLDRIVARDHVDPSEAAKVMAAQMDPEEKIKRADFVINNSGSLQQAYDNVLDIANVLRDS